MESNVILMIVATVIVGAMIITSNMNYREQKQTLLLIILISVAVGLKFAIWGYYLIPAVLVGAFLGGCANASIAKRRIKLYNEIIKENKTSL